jgi:predicted ATPase
MLTRLKVKGFKNLVDVDVRFGPFTCVAGVNAVGKSNLFDAIALLRALADKPLVDAALSVRDEGGRTGDVRAVFHRDAEGVSRRMDFEAEMIISKEGLDDLGQAAKARTTFLRYSLSLGYRGENGSAQPGPLEILSEELSYIRRSELKQHLLFPRSKEWEATAVQGRAGSQEFISTSTKEDTRRVLMHSEGRAGRPRELLAHTLPRTALSSVNAVENPTATLARREMRSWRLWQLEPSALRQPDAFTATPQLGLDGSHLAATIYRLARLNGARGGAQAVYAQLANRLAELIDDVRSLSIDSDEKRELRTLLVTDRTGTPHAARSLSDGTLRFLALAALELDPEATGLICLEEPENGIHPARIPAILRLLQDTAMDPREGVGEDNPLRQVIVNTHSPAVVQLVPEDSLLVAETTLHNVHGGPRKGVTFAALPRTWRTKSKVARAVALGKLLDYLSSVPGDEGRVIDRHDVQMLLPFATDRGSA